MNPFENLSSSQKTRLLSLLQVHIYKYNKQQEILSTIKRENIICIVITGTVQIIKIDYNGNEIILENLKENDIFGSNISDINNENCEIIAKEYTEILVIDYDILLNEKNFNYSYFNIFFKNVFDIINNKYRETNNKIRILEEKTIRNRLLEYFEIEYKKTSLRTITLPFNLKDLADYIAVNRSAMFRELKSLKEEKFISIKGKKITLLYKRNGETSLFYNT